MYNGGEIPHPTLPPTANSSTVYIYAPMQEVLLGIQNVTFQLKPLSKNFYQNTSE